MLRLILITLLYAVIIFPLVYICRIKKDQDNDPDLSALAAREIVKKKYDNLDFQKFFDWANLKGHKQIKVKHIKNYIKEVGYEKVN